MKPRKKRSVVYPPSFLGFRPYGLKESAANKVILKVEEYEAVRLADHKGLKHEEAAKKMNISRPTFTRLIESARSKISDALVNGKVIKIEGGDFILKKNRYRCRTCGALWSADKNPAGGPNVVCPDCSSTQVEDIGLRLTPEVRKGRHGRRWH